MEKPCGWMGVMGMDGKHGNGWGGMGMDGRYADGWPCGLAAAMALLHTEQMLKGKEEQKKTILGTGVLWMVLFFVMKAVGLLLALSS